MSTLTREQLRPNMLVVSGRTLLQISTLYEDGNVTAQVILDAGAKGPPGRTRVWWLTPSQIDRLREPSKQLLNKAEDAWGRPVYR